MKLHLLIGVCYIICGTLALPSKRGACVVTCSPGNGLFDTLGLSDCPSGTVCRSTGCGAVCSPVQTQTARPHAFRRGTCAMTDIQCSPQTGSYDDLNLPYCPDASRRGTCSIQCSPQQELCCDVRGLL